MGRKGVSKRKPKKTKSGANENINHGSANRHSGESQSVQLLVKEKGIPFNFNRSDANPGPNKKNRKGK
jgi:hypothetical protein